MTDHKVTVRYNTGYIYDPQAVCSCGWRGPFRVTVSSLSNRGYRQSQKDAFKHWKAVVGYGSKGEK